MRRMTGPEPTHVAGVSGLVVRDGHLLMVRRSRHGPAPRRWALPGGKVEPGETLQQALRREIREETGLRVRIGRPAGAVIRERYLIVCYWCEVSGGTLAEGDDAEIAQWVPVGEVARRT